MITRNPKNGRTSLRFRRFTLTAIIVLLLVPTGCTEVSEDDEDRAPTAMTGRLRPNPSLEENAPRH